MYYHSILKSFPIPSSFKIYGIPTTKVIPLMLIRKRQNSSYQLTKNQMPNTVKKKSEKKKWKKKPLKRRGGLVTSTLETMLGSELIGRGERKPWRNIPLLGAYEGTVFVEWEYMMANRAIVGKRGEVHKYLTKVTVTDTVVGIVFTMQKERFNRSWGAALAPSPSLTTVGYSTVTLYRNV